MKRRLLSVGAALTAMLAQHPATGWAANIQLQDETSFRLASMQQIKEALAVAPSPEAWDVAVFISSGVISDLAAAATGVQVVLPASSLQPGISLELVGSKITSETGALRAGLDFKAQIASIGPKIPLHAEALLVVAAVDRDPDRPNALFLSLVPRIVSVGPSAGGGGAFGDMIDRIIATGVMKALEDKLFIQVPLTNAFSLSTALDNNFTARVSSGAAIAFHIKSVGETLQSRLQYRPVVTADGLWALARQARPGEPDGIVQNAADATPADKAQLDELSHSVTAMLASFAPPKGALAVHVGQNLLAHLIDAYNTIPADKRVITVNSTRVSGKLFEKKWRDNVLGDGGIYVELTDASAASGTIHSGAVTQSWDKDQMAFNLELPASVDAKAKIYVHVDPLIGGGAGTTIGMVGAAGLDLRVSARLMHRGAEGQDAIWLEPDIPCQRIPVSLKTDGTVKLPGIAVEVPAIGANFSAPIGKDALRPAAILDTIPHVLRLFGEADDGASAKPRLIFPQTMDAVRVTLSGLGLRSDQSGAWLSADQVAIQPVLQAGTPEPGLAPDQLSNKVREIRQNERAACSSDASMELIVGDIDIGKNNDFVNAARQAGKALGDIKRTTDRALDDSRNTLEKAGRDLNRGANEAKKTIERVIPKIKIKSPF